MGCRIVRVSKALSSHHWRSDGFRHASCVGCGIPEEDDRAEETCPAVLSVPVTEEKPQ